MRDPSSDLKFEREVATQKAVSASLAKTRLAAAVGGAAGGEEKRAGGKGGGGQGAGGAQPPWRGAVHPASEKAQKQRSADEAARRKGRPGVARTGVPSGGLELEWAYGYR